MGRSGIRTGNALKIKIGLAIAAGVLIGYIIGMSVATYQALNWCANMGFKLLELNNIQINIDKGLLVEGLTRYGANINQLLNITQ
jgi:hypothetical protein